MQVPGKRIKRQRLIQRGRNVVAVDVELVVPDSEPSEPCYEPETVGFLKQVAGHAEAGDLDWLRRHGTVYELVESN